MLENNVKVLLIVVVLLKFMEYPELESEYLFELITSFLLLHSSTAPVPILSNDRPVQTAHFILLISRKRGRGITEYAACFGRSLNRQNGLQSEPYTRDSLLRLKPAPRGRSAPGKYCCRQKLLFPENQQNLHLGMTAYPT